MAIATRMATIQMAFLSRARKSIWVIMGNGLRCVPSRLYRPALEGKEATRAALDEEDDEDEDQDLGDHGAGIGLEELVGDADREGADQRAPEIADAAEDHDHEAVDDVVLPKVRRDVVDLAQRHAG